MNTVQNERIKLTASWLNGVGTAAAAAGAIAPAAAAFYGVGAGPAASLRLAAGMFLWIATGVCLHIAARHVLGRLEQ